MSQPSRRLGVNPVRARRRRGRAVSQVITGELALARNTRWQEEGKISPEMRARMDARQARRIVASHAVVRDDDALMAHHVPASRRTPTARPAARRPGCGRSTRSTSRGDPDPGDPSDLAEAVA